MRSGVFKEKKNFSVCLFLDAILHSADTDQTKTISYSLLQDISSMLKNWYITAFVKYLYHLEPTIVQVPIHQFSSSILLSNVPLFFFL